MSGLLTIQGVSGSGPSYTLTVPSTAGMSSDDHVVTPRLSDTSRGGVYLVTSVPDTVTIIVSDELEPGGGTYGSPTTGTGAYWTPLSNGVSNIKPNGCPYWGDVTERDLQLLSGGWIEDEFTPSNGQVSFTLTRAPSDGFSRELFVNGVLADETGEYTISGETLTWLNTNFSLSTDDFLIARYK